MSKKASEPIARDRLIEALACVPTSPCKAHLSAIARDAGYEDISVLHKELRAFAERTGIVLEISNSRTNGGSGFSVSVPRGWRDQLDAVVNQYIAARGEMW
jgi:hypothetical protein